MNSRIEPGIVIPLPGVNIPDVKENRRAPAKKRRTLLVLSQTFVPDPASVGQHMADVAFEMARRGYRVLVYTSGRGYEDPRIKYPPREIIDGVIVRRLPLGSFGKKSMFLRVLGTAFFQIQCLLVGLTTTQVDGVFFSTSPPLIGVVAALIGFFRNVRIAYWAMDLNPDQLIALGKIGPTSHAAHFLEGANRLVLRRCSLVVALDRFMAERLASRADLMDKMLVMPPWPHETHIESAITERSEPNPFRVRHQMDSNFVVMYSGNHSPANPLTTLLNAAIAMKNDPRVRFVMIGGGAGKREVEEAIRQHSLGNVQSLPYQPLSELKHSLSAADLHVVTLGADMVGIVHPCKIYGAMAAGRPILYFGPRPSHITDLLDGNGFGACVAHGDVAGAVAAIEKLSHAPQDELKHLGAKALSVLRDSFGQRVLLARFCDRLERALFGEQ